MDRCGALMYAGVQGDKTTLDKLEKFIENPKLVDIFNHQKESMKNITDGFGVWRICTLILSLAQK